MTKTRFRPGTLALVLLAAACGHSSHAPRSMAPGNCAKPDWQSLPSNASQTRPLVAGPDTAVGIRVVQRTASPGFGYWVDHAFVDVLRPGAPVDNRIFGKLDTTVLSVRADNFSGSANRTLSITFTGKDRAGLSLPPGRYPVMFQIRAHGAGKCLEKFTASISSVITNLDWRG